MASIINNISFNNFFNYFGEFEDNSYDLEEGVNIIVADNGAGKSKFFNAFLWLFNDQILDSDDKITKNIKDVFVKIISDKAKYDTGIQDRVNCGVRVEYTSGTRKKYQITKSFTVTRLAESITDSNGWQFILNDVEVNETELVLHKYKPVYDEESKKRIIEKLIMPAFRKYSFLQGEEVDKIIDFSHKSSIEDAVQNLTDIKKYEKLVELTKDLKDKAEKDLDKQNKSSDKQSSQYSLAIELKKTKDEELGRVEESLQQFKDTFDNAQNEKNELDKSSANAEKRKGIDDKIKEEKRKRKNIEQEYLDFLEKINNRFFDGNFAWISMGFTQVLNDFKDQNSEYIQKHYEKKTLLEVEDNPNKFFHLLPVNSPDTVSLQNMIDNEKCYVCGTEAKEGSPEHENLLQLRDRPNLAKKEKKYVKNNIVDFFGNIQIDAQPFYNKIDLIPESVKQTKQKEKELKEKLEKIDKKLKSLTDQRKDIIVAGSGEDSEIINNYKGAIRRMESSRSKINDVFSPKRTKLKTEIKNIENEIESLSKTQDIPEGFKINYSMSKDLAMATENAKDRVFDNMIGLLEKHANIHFKDLIANNELKGGILKFEKSPSGSIAFNYIDKKGNVVHGSSEGFQRMKKFSVVMAIISASSTQYNYPLLADAPISAFGEGFAEGFFEATGNVFPQSIILVKELYDRKDEQKLTDLGKRLLKDNNVKKMYVNQVPNDAEQIELVTTKLTLK